MSNQSKLIKIYKRLLTHFGPQAWWPAETPFEVIVGAILTQNTNWKNVEKAIANLKKSKVLSPGSLSKIKNSKLGSLIRTSGYFRQKARKLKAFVKYFLKNYKGSLQKMKKKNISELRKELLDVHGIGPETADSILLYALDKPTFVVDAYTRRIGQRMRLFKSNDYHEIKEYFEQNLPRDLEIYKEYHALLVELGKNFCKTRPNCGNCSVKKLCARKIP
jgi:endonuclease-3 related protein